MKFEVIVKITREYEIPFEVEAKNEESAKDIAETDWRKEDTGINFIVGETTDWAVIRVAEVKQ